MKLIQKTAATRRNEIEGVLKQKGVSIGDTKMDPKKPPGKDGQTEVMITTNVYPLELQSANEQFIYHYEVNVVGIGSKENENDISQQTYPADYLKVLDRTRCAVVFLAFWEKLKSQDMNTWNTIAYYDCRKALFAVKELQQIEDTLSLEEVNRIYLLPDEKFQKFRVTISNAVEGTPAKVSLSQFQRITSDAEPSDRSVEQFVDIATSQNIFKGMGKFIHFSTALSYLLSPVEYGFKDEDCPYFSSNNSYLGIGVGKGARVIEGSRPEEPALALVINIVKSPFHAHEALLAKLEVVFRNVDLATVANGELERIGRYFKGLWVETNYLPHQAFPIHDIVKENAQTVKLDENATIQDHFKKKDINLIHPDYPLVVRRGADGKLSHFPIEVLWVSDNQRVKTAQQVPAQLQEMIRKCAVPPILKLEENKRVKNALSLQDDVHLKGAGIKFKDEPLKVKGRVIAPPELQFGGGRPVRPKDNGTWTGTGHFLHKANCSMWCAYAITDRRNRQDITLDEWNNFLQRYYQFLTQKGLNWPYPEDVRVFPVASVNVKQLIYDAAQNGAEFCFIAHPDSADHIHHQMKLNERQTEMVTQGLKIGTVRSVLSKGQQLTLSNIANKTNMKMGGENYTLATLREPVIDEDTLIIGFSVNHPGGGLGMATANGNGEGGGNGGNGKNGQGNGKNGHGNGNGKSAPGNGNGKNGGHGGYASAIQAPSVVGYSANIGQHDKFEFIGGYMFQEPRRDEKVAIISNAVKNCAEQFKENRHRDPKRIVIYRNGCSEGFFQHILRYEIPMVKSALEELNLGNCRLTLMVVNKLQNIALIPSKLDARAKAADQNVKPGTVVDTQIVHPKWNEFFLNSHRAIQGTTRTPKYSVLLDENAHTMDQLQKLTYSLCYGHQIVFSPTSLPSPVYIADEYAKRGRNNYNTMAADEVFANYDQMDMVLGLSQTNYLRKLRFNA